MSGRGVATFVVPVFIRSEDGLRYLNEAIDGLRNQTCDEWQAIFIDDCSPVQDVKSLLLARQSGDDRLNCVFLEDRRSTGVCRNIGIEWAHKRMSSVVMFNDADDVSHPTRVEVVNHIMAEHPEVAVVYSGFSVIDEHSRPVPREGVAPPIAEIIESIADGPPLGRNCWYTIGLKCGYTNITSSTAVRTELAVRVQFPDEFVSEDSHTWYRYAAHGEFFYTDRCPTFYRIPSGVVRQSSYSYVDNFNRTKARVDWDGFSQALRLAVDRGAVDGRLCPLIEAKFLLRLAESMGKDNEFELAHLLAMRAWKKIADYEEVIFD